MRLGLFMMPLHSLGRDYGEMFAEDAAAVLHADRVGFDEAFVGEHYAAQVEPISNPLQFMSALIPQTERLTFGTGVLNLPHHHPAKVAADVALFDHMSGGRFVMGIGPGGLPSDFELFGTLEADRTAMMTECLDMVHRIWASDPPYDIEGEHWHVRIVDTVQHDLGIGPIPKPLQRPHPPVAVSAMSPFSGTARLAGSRGWHLISANFNPTVHTASHWQVYTQGAEEAGRTPDRATWRVARSVLGTETDAEAYLARPGNSIAAYFNYLLVQFRRAGLSKIMIDDPAMDESDLTLAYCLDRMVIAGSPATVRDRLIDLVDRIGPFGTLLAAFHEWDDAPLWRDSMERLASKVMPQVSRAIDGQKAAE